VRKLTWRFIALVLVFLTLCRLGYSMWQWQRVHDAGGLWPVLLGGWRIDLSLLAMVVGAPALLAPWLGHRAWPTRITAVWYRIWWLAFVLLEVSTPQFLIEYDTRPNRLWFEYLTSPNEVVGMLWHGYKLVVGVGLVVFVLLGWLGFRLLPTRQPDRVPVRGWLRPVATVAVFCVVFLAARGTLQHRPLNASQVAFTNDAMVNTLPLNSLYNVLNAARALGSERSAAAVYGKMPEDEMNAIVRQAAGFQGPPIDARYPSLHRQQATRTDGKPLNLVIILEESLGAQFVGSLGGAGYTPELDKLSNEGWWFTRAYATGTRSARGLEAVTTGFLPTPAEAVLKLPRSQRDFFTLGALLDQSGYHTRFLYGGEAHFDNMRSFFFGNGFNEVVDRASFKTKPAFVGSWGASDEDMFNELHQRLLDDGDKPTLTVAFSVSNHTPWEYPQGRIKAEGDPASNANAVRYADWSIGRFFDRAKQSPYWSHTVFVVVADHDARVFGASLVPVRHFHIPALILGAGVPVKKDDRIMSQVDLGPTLLSLIGISSEHPMLGADLTQREPNRAIMQYGDNYGYLKGDQLVILRPNQPATQYHYQVDGEKLDPAAAPDPQLEKEALAHALWPSWAYGKQRYRLPSDTAKPKAD
jgi:phosphoglycerol transferase MdoB-like AlkP superfamily enzyme